MFSAYISAYYSSPHRIKCEAANFGPLQELIMYDGPSSWRKLGEVRKVMRHWLGFPSQHHTKETGTRVWQTTTTTTTSRKALRGPWGKADVGDTLPPPRFRTNTISLGFCKNALEEYQSEGSLYLPYGTFSNKEDWVPLSLMTLLLRPYNESPGDIWIRHTMRQQIFHTLKNEIIYNVPSFNIKQNSVK